MVVLPKVSIDTDMHKSMCFGCGQNNPIGLKLVFAREGNAVKAEYTPPQVFQGWPGILHGGILGCMLDEAMNNAAYLEGIPCLTASMQVRLRQPVKVEEPLIITAWVTRNRKKLIETSAKICLKDGTVIAESTSKQFVVESAQGDDKYYKESQHDA